MIFFLTFTAASLNHNATKGFRAAAAARVSAVCRRPLAADFLLQHSAHGGLPLAPALTRPAFFYDKPLMATTMNHNEVTTVTYDGMALSADFSPSTLAWLEWYNGLPEAQRPMVSYAPPELALARMKHAAGARDEAVLKNKPIVIDTPRVDSYDEAGRPVFCLDNWDGTLLYGNCFAYAMNLQTQESGVLLAPGMVRGLYIDHSNDAPEHVWRSLLHETNEDIRSGKLGEIIDMNPCELSSSLGKNEYRVALCLAVVGGQFRDFHWYREDADDGWSHKRGLSFVCRVDAAGQPINRDNPPESCNRSYPEINYNFFCGYYKLQHR